MTSKLVGYKIFIASPGGLGSVRTRFRTDIAKYNEDDAMRRGIVFIPVGWEATLGGLKRPQSIINKELEQCDAVVLVLHDRWGTPSTAGYASNTMEEFELSRGWLTDANKPMREIQVLFKAVEPRQLTDPGQQLQAVLDFKKQIQDQDLLMYHQFDSDNEFADILRKFLAELVWRHEQDAKAAEGETIAPAEAVVTAVPEAPPVTETHTEETIEEPSIELAERLANDHQWIEAERVFATLLSGPVDVPTMIAYAKFLERQRRRSKAASLLDDAAAAAKAAANRRWIGLASLAKGKFLHAIDGEATSLPLVRAAVAELQDPGADRADALLTLADFSYHDEEPTSAVDELHAAETAVLPTGAPTLLARLDGLRARRAFNEGAFDAAIGQYQSAIDMAEGHLANTEIGDMYLGLGVALERISKVDDALKAYRAGGRLFEREEAMPKLADALDLQANAELALGHPEVAAALYDRAAGLFETIAKFGSAVDAYLSLAKVETGLGRIAAVEDAEARALALAPRLSDQSEVDELYQRLAQGDADSTTTDPPETEA